MDKDAELNKLMRRMQTLESRLQDLAERLSAYESGTDKNPNRAVYVQDGQGSGVAKVDFDASAGTLRVTKVR